MSLVEQGLEGGEPDPPVGVVQRPDDEICLDSIPQVTEQRDGNRPCPGLRSVQFTGECALGVGVEQRLLRPSLREGEDLEIAVSNRVDQRRRVGGAHPQYE